MDIMITEHADYGDWSIDVSLIPDSGTSYAYYYNTTHKLPGFPDSEIDRIVRLWINERYADMSLNEFLNRLLGGTSDTSHNAIGRNTEW